MLFFLILVSVLLFIGVAGYGFRMKKLKEIQTMFREYNDAGNENVIFQWIEKQDNESRLIRVLEYLAKIENEALAISVYKHFEGSGFKHRHVGVFTTKAFKKMDHQEEAIACAKRLLNDFPGDDAILELFLDVHLHFGQTDIVRKYLNDRLQRKFKGTIFHRFRAQILVEDGELEEALKIMEDVTRREYILSSNTFAQPQKALIYYQYEESQKVLNDIRRKLGYDVPEPEPESEHDAESETEQASSES